MSNNGEIFRTGAMEWLELINDHNGAKLYDKRLVADEKTGMVVNLSKYPAGYMTTWHTHTHAHGMYVIEGRLYTNLGIVNKGEFVWFPEGALMEHGAMPDEDCTVVFITNGPFSIEYKDPE